jgi:hypothetical protein
MSIFQEILGIINTVAEAVAPGVVTAADAAIVGIFQIVAKVAHPNTVAYKVANAGIAVLNGSVVTPTVTIGKQATVKP